MKKLSATLLIAIASSYIMLCASCVNGKLTKGAETAIEAGLDFVCEAVAPLVLKGVDVGDACEHEHAFMQGLLDSISEPAIEPPVKLAFVPTRAVKHAVHRKNRKHPSAWIRGEKLAKQLQAAIVAHEASK